MTKIISISLTDEEKEWLDEYNVSPTQLMKFKIAEMMTTTIGERKKIRQLEDVIMRLNDKIVELSQEKENAAKI